MRLSSSSLSLSNEVIGSVSAGKEEGAGIGHDWSRGSDWKGLAGSRIGGGGGGGGRRRGGGGEVSEARILLHCNLRS